MSEFPVPPRDAREPAGARAEPPLAPNDEKGEGRITTLLGAWRGGSESAFAELASLIYGELGRLARLYLHRERQRPTFDTRDFIHEAFLRLSGLRTVDWQDRAHFFAVAARIMRRLLIDRARQRQNAKHGGDLVEVRLAEIPDLAVERDAHLIALEDALVELEQVDEPLARIVELRFFGGLDHDEVAAVLGLSNPTVRRHWRLAKSWLRRSPVCSAAGPPKRASPTW